MGSEPSGSVMAVSSLREFFRDAFHTASEHQRLALDPSAEAYVVNMLTVFARADSFYEQTAEGLRIKPLAQMLAEALEAPTPDARQRSLQRLGDVSLFVAGFFARSFARKLIDIDYHIAMGGSAYGSLAEALQRSWRGRCVAAIYAELSANFQRLVDALNEISDSGYQHSDADVLRLYEIWMKTGSRRAHGLLRGLGVEPGAAGARALNL